MNEVILDPHEEPFVSAAIARADKEDLAYWKKCRKENNKLYAFAAQNGIESNGWLFYPPFFCMYCGGPISANQWFASRCHDTSDDSLVMMRLGVSLAGKFVPVPTCCKPMRTPISVYTQIGKQFAAQAKGIIEMARQRRRPRPMQPRQLSGRARIG